MSYTNAFIRVSTDCPADRGIVPVAKGDRKPIHVLQYELLAESPYRYTHEDLIWEVHIRHKGLAEAELEARAAEIRAELFAKPHPCLRASLLPKKYGWGVHYDEQGRIAIYPMESAEYQDFTRPEGDISLLYALRSKRA